MLTETDTLTTALVRATNALDDAYRLAKLLPGGHPVRAALAEAQVKAHLARTHIGEDIAF